MTKILFIEADTNDGDYIVEESVIEGFLEENMEAVRRVAKRVTENLDAQHNWPETDRINEAPADIYPDMSEDDLDIFANYVPCQEGGIHTVTRVEIREVTVLEKFG